MRKLRVAGAIVVVAAVAATGTYLFASGSTGTSNTGGSGDNGAATSVTVTTAKSTSSAPTSTRVTQLSEMPDLVGKLLGAARDELPVSLEVVVEETFDNTKPDGTVTKQDPEPGGAVGRKVTLTVARPAYTVFLDSLRPASGAWSNSQGEIVGMAGKAYPHSLLDSVSTCSSKQAVEYNLSKGYRKLVTTVGLSDNSEYSPLQVQLEVFADEGRLLATANVKVGEVVPLDLDVTNVLRLKFQWLPARATGGCNSSNAIVLGDAKLLGVAGEVPTSGLPPTSTRGTTTTTTTR